VRRKDTDPELLEILYGIGRMLQEIDAKLERIVTLLKYGTEDE
jgi:hypothetical protein